VWESVVGGRGGAGSGGFEREGERESAGRAAEVSRTRRSSAAGRGIAGEATVAVVQPDAEGAIGEGFVADEVEVGVVIEVDGEELGGLSDREAGAVGAVVAIEIGGGPDVLG